MLCNEFKNAPTVGSDDYNSSTDELHARVNHLEQRFAAAEEKKQPKDHKSGKIKWKKVRKFFGDCIKPILDFIPRLLNATAMLVNAVALYIKISEAIKAAQADRAAQAAKA